MTGADWAPIVQAVIAGIAMVLTTLIGIYVPRAIAAFERRTGVAVTDQERAAVMSAVTTGAGLLRTKIDQGIIGIRDVTQSSAAVLNEVQGVLTRVPDAAAAQGVTMDALKAMIVARVDTSPAAVAPAPVPRIPAPPP